VKNNLVDMRNKLNDIQNNKTFLEKKIYEYEKKLVELKGGPQNSSGAAYGNEPLKNSNGLNTQKIDISSSSFLEKSLLDSKK